MGEWEEWRTCLWCGGEDVYDGDDDDKNEGDESRGLEAECRVAARPSIEAHDLTLTCEPLIMVVRHTQAPFSRTVGKKSWGKNMLMTRSVKAGLIKEVEIRNFLLPNDGRAPSFMKPRRDGFYVVIENTLCGTRTGGFRRAS